MEKEKKLREIGKEITDKFSFREIWRVKENFLNEPQILAFIELNYKSFIKDIDYIIVIAYRISRKQYFG